MILEKLILIFILLMGSFSATLVIMPKIISLVTYKNLMDKPNRRSSHSIMVPSLGGIAFYIIIILGIYFLQSEDKTNVSMSLIPGLLVLFIVGLKDDLVVLSPLTKLAAQIISVSFILFHTDFQISHLNGFLGFERISLVFAIPLSIFIMIAIINSYNLIDGIDGLAAIIGILIFSVYGILFYLIQQYFYLGISTLIIGSLLGFLRFNLSSSRKIFMGDTGSLIIGFLISVLTIKFFAIESESLKKIPILLENLPLLVLAILVVPFFDTTRVFTIRLMNKRGPFSPDRSHIHHLLIDYMNLSHRRASFYIGIANFAFVLVFLFLGANFSNSLLLGIMLLIIVVFVYYFYRINFSYSNMKRRLKIRKKIRRINYFSKES